jgi:PPM family protein phosphatase
MNTLGPIEASLRTDQGLIRDHNEDFVTCLEPNTAEEAAQNGWLYVVADGVGGADAGEVASQYASERTINHFLENSDTADWGERLLQAMQGANDDLRQMVVDRNDNKRMATTMVAALIYEQTALIANVGDSRGYLWHSNQLTQLTRDQSLVAKLVEEGAITESEAINHPHKNVILYSIGSERVPKIDLFEHNLTAGDMLVLCSDGLTRHVDDEEISEIIQQQGPAEATQTLIKMANERGGQDNISVAVIRYGAAQQKRPSSPPQNRAAATVTPVPARSQATASGRSFLWMYTIVLSMVQTLLILLVWFLLHI